MKQRVLLKGRDALDLLHRISTINTHHLNLNEKIPALFLNAQGKILCFFEITLVAEEEVLIDFEENFLEVMDQYTFSEKYQIEKIPAPPIEEFNEKERIGRLIPRLNYEFKNNGETNPLEVNLRNAIHDQKGCYPGQEVIEKVISLGSPARKLCLLSGESAQEVPSALFDEATGTEVGVLTSVANQMGLAIIRRTHLKPGLKLKSNHGQWVISQVS